MLIKVCGITQYDQAKALDAFEVDFIGQIFYDKSPRFVHEVISNCLAPRVGVFVNESIDMVTSTCNKHNIKSVQLHGVESPEYCMELKSQGFKVFKAVAVDDQIQADIQDYEASVDYLLFDTASKQHGGTGQHFNWEILEHHAIEIPFFLSGGISIEDVDQIMEIKAHQKNMIGVDINSRFETSPGIKDLDLVNRFIKKIKHHD